MRIIQIHALSRQAAKYLILRLYHLLSSGNRGVACQYQEEMNED